METYSIHKGAAIAPLKARMTLDLIRGKKVSQAEAILLTTNTKASRLIIKVLNSAVSNAVNNFGANKEDLVIKETYINEGRTLSSQVETLQNEYNSLVKDLIESLGDELKGAAGDALKDDPDIKPYIEKYKRTDPNIGPIDVDDGDLPF